MSDGYAYSCGVLRYYHDIATGEFVNVGVALLSPQTRFLGIRCTTSASRAAAFFPDLNQEALLSMLRAIEERFKVVSERTRLGSSSVQGATLLDVAKAILPPDASSLRWATAGSGVTLDPELELSRLYGRTVQRYELDALHRALTTLHYDELLASASALATIHAGATLAQDTTTNEISLGNVLVLQQSFNLNSYTYPLPSLVGSGVLSQITRGYPFEPPRAEEQRQEASWYGTANIYVSAAVNSTPSTPSDTAQHVTPFTQIGLGNAASRSDKT